MNFNEEKLKAQIEKEKNYHPKDTFSKSNAVKFVLVNYRDDFNVPSFQPVEGTDPQIISELADIDYVGNPVHNPITQALRQKEADINPDVEETVATQTVDETGSVTSWQASNVYRKKFNPSVKMKVYDDDGLLIDGYDYRKHMVLGNLNIKKTPEWVNPNLFYRYNEQQIRDRENYTNQLIEQRSSILDSCKDQGQVSTKALKEYRKKLNASEMSFKESHLDDGVYTNISYVSDIQSRFSSRPEHKNNPNQLLEMVDDEPTNCPHASDLVTNLKEGKAKEVTEDEFDALFNEITGGEDIIQGEGNVWENNENIVPTDVYGDDRDKDFDMMDDEFDEQLDYEKELQEKVKTDQNNKNIVSLTIEEENKLEQVNKNTIDSLKYYFSADELKNIDGAYIVQEEEEMESGMNSIVEDSEEWEDDSQQDKNGQKVKDNNKIDQNDDWETVSSDSGWQTQSSSVSEDGESDDVSSEELINKKPIKKKKKNVKIENVDNEVKNDKIKPKKVAFADVNDDQNKADTNLTKSNDNTQTKSILKPSKKAEVPDFVKNAKSEQELESHLQNNLEDCLKYLDTPINTETDLAFFDKVKSMHKEYENEQLLLEVKDQNNNNLNLSMETDGLLNKDVKKKNPKYNYLSLEEAEELHVKDINGELLATIPEFDAFEDTEMPDRKYKREREFDCQTIVSTFSTTDNLPTMYKLDKLEELVQKQNERERRREETRQTRINESMMSINSIKEQLYEATNVLSMKRERNEDPEVRKVRKDAIKALKKEKREFKKQLKSEYGKTKEELVKVKDRFHRVSVMEV